MRNEPRHTPLAEAKARLLLAPGSQKHPIFEHAIIIERYRHENHIPRALGIKPGDNIIEQAEPRRAQAAIEAEPALGEDRLGGAAGRSHLHIARQHPAIERIA